MQKFFEATGENRDAAVENALKQLGLERDDVSVEVLEIGKKGFLGIGATPARVRVTYEAPDIPAAKPEVKKEERKPAPKTEPKQQEKPVVKAEKPAPKQEKPAEKPQKLSITTDDNTPRLVKAAPADFVPEKLEFERPPRRERSDRPRRDRGDRNGRDRRPRRPREDRPITPSVPKERELIPVSEAGMQQAEKLATDFVTGLLAKMGVEGQVKTLPQVECDQLRLEISGPDMGPIIGRRGDTLDAIQYLGSLVLNNALDEHVRLSVDTENYREKRAESLERLARKMAMKVVKAHRSMTLEPMNPYERRIIHTAVQEVEGAKSWSEGEDLARHVVIGPEGGERYVRRDNRRSGNNRGRNGGYNRDNRGGRAPRRDNRDSRPAQNRTAPAAPRVLDDVSTPYGKISKN